MSALTRADRANETWFAGKPESLASVVKRLDGALAPQRFVDSCMTRAYFGQALFPGATSSTAFGSSIPSAYSFIQSLAPLAQENLVCSVIDAAAAMVVRTPAVRVLVSGAPWRKVINARKMSRLLTGVFHTSGLEDVAATVWRDSALCQLGAVKWSIGTDGKVTCDRVLPHQIVWNPAEGPNPRSIFLRWGVPRSRLIAENPDKADEIERLPAYKPDPLFALDEDIFAPDSDRVEVIEGWRRAEGDDVGRFVQVAGGVVLQDEEWTLPLWPVVPLKSDDSHGTLGGVPLARQVFPFQAQLNRFADIEKDAMRLVPPKVLAPKGSIEQWTNAVEVVTFETALGAPVLMPGQMLPPQFWARRQEIKAAAFEQVGVNAALAAGKKADGISSAKGQREVYELASGRLVLRAMRLERWFGENARVAMALMAAAYKDKKLRDRAPNTSLLKEISWDQVDVREDEITFRAFITSAIPNTPWGRSETIQEWINAEVVGPKRAARLYATGDVDGLEDAEAAAEDLAMRCIESALYDGEYLPPEPVMGPDGLQMVIDLGGKQLMRALTAPEDARPPAENLELLRRLIEEAKLYLQPPAPPPAPAAAPVAPTGPVAAPPPEMAAGLPPEVMSETPPPA